MFRVVACGGVRRGSRRVTQRPVSVRRTPGEDFAGSFSGSVTPESAGVPSGE